MNDESPKALLSIRAITKAFALNSVLRGIDLDLYAGDVLALIGGNGAGKSTLMKIIMGIHQPDDGTISIEGQIVRLHNPAAALAQGVYLVPQEPMLFPHLTIEENVVMGFSSRRSDLHKKLAALIGQLGWDLDLNRRAGSLSIAEQQLVELLRGLMRDAKILILDEPTSSLTFNEVQSLFRIVEDLRAKGIGIIYITHRLGEVFKIATKVAIMRDGCITLSGRVAEFTREILVKGLLPDNAEEADASSPGERAKRASSEPALVVDRLSGNGFDDVSLKVFPGEIVGLAGVVGAGRTELATTIFGRDAPRSGRAYLNGADITGKPTGAVMAKGLAYVPEDRFLNGIFRISDVAVNTSASNLSGVGKVFIDGRKERGLANRFAKLFRIKITGIDQSMGSLSGGNQQKVVIARSLASNPKLLILDEPTRGIDAGARGDVYAIIQELKAQGLAILLISSDMDEIVALSDRAMVMYCGRINGEFAREEITQDSLMAAAFGVSQGVSHK